MYLSAVFAQLGYWLSIIGFSVTGSILIIYLFNRLSSGEHRAGVHWSELLANGVIGLCLCAIFLFLAAALSGTVR